MCGNEKQVVSETGPPRSGFRSGDEQEGRVPGNNYPKLHNAMWPGLVGKGPESEPPIDLDTMLRLTAAARAGGVKFEGVDLFLADPHTSIDSSKDDIKRLADRISGYALAVGSVVAPVWPPVGGGSATGSAEDRKQFLTMVEKACCIARQLRDIGIRQTGVVRIVSATGVRRDRQRRRLSRQNRTPLHGRRSERKARYHLLCGLLAARR